MRAPIQINTRSDIPRAISMMQVAGAGHRVPVMQALYHGRIAHLEIARNSSGGLLKAWMALARLPALALIGDDDDGFPAGPNTWRQAPRLLRWARFVLIHGAAGAPEQYELAVALTEKHQRVVMVECSSANITAWCNAAERWGNGAKGQVVMPPPGQPHPSLEKSQMQ